MYWNGFFGPFLLAFYKCFCVLFYYKRHKGTKINFASVCMCLYPHIVDSLSLFYIYSPRPFFCVGELKRKELIALAGGIHALTSAKGQLTKVLDLLHRMGLIAAVVPFGVKSGEIAPGTVASAGSTAFLFRTEGQYEEPIGVETEQANNTTTNSAAVEGGTVAGTTGSEKAPRTATAPPTAAAEWTVEVRNALVEVVQTFLGVFFCLLHRIPEFRGTIMYIYIYIMFTPPHMIHTRNVR